MHNWLQGVWYRNAPSGAFLRPLSWLFAGLVSLRHGLYRAGWLRAYAVGRPVVVVGNLTVGGSGKTPLTLWLAAQLRKRGVNPGVVLRGYGAARSTPRLVMAGSSYEEVGDEALLIARRGDAVVAIGSNRVAAARLLLEQGVDLVIADDGLQHLALRRDLEIVVIDGERRFGNGRLLPAGPLREPTERLKSVDFTVANGAASAAEEIPMALRFSHAVPLQGGAARPLADFAGQPVHAIAGIGHPQRFFRMLETSGIQPIPHPFADHYRLTPADVQFADSLPVLMTEKDAVRCERFAGPQHWFVPVEAQLQGPHAQALLQSVLALLPAR